MKRKKVSMNACEKKLNHRTRQGSLRRLRLSENCVDFASNDYLGLARSQALLQAVHEEWERFSRQSFLNGLGSTGSRLLTGNSLYAVELEEKIAAFHGYETGLLFSCGYMANTGLLSSIAEPQDAVFFDAHIHASMRRNPAEPGPRVPIPA